MEEELFSELRLNDRDILEALSEVGVFITDYLTGRNLSSSVWNSSTYKFDPHDRDESFLNQLHPDDRERARETLAKVYRGESDSLDLNYRLNSKEGDYRWILSRGLVVRKTKEGRPLLVVGSDSDISELKETEEKLRHSIEKEKKRNEELETLRQIISSISSSLDIQETIDQILKQISRLIPYESCSLQILRGDHLEVVGGEGFEDNDFVKTLRFRFPDRGSLSTRAVQEEKPFVANDVTRDFPSLTQPSKTRTILSWLGVPLIAHGNVLGLLAMDGYVRNRFDSHHLELAGIIGQHIAIAMENALLHEKAFKLAMEDALTGLGNRHRMSMEGRFLFESAIRNGQEISFAMLDIDHFKKVNDSYGHDVGDIILKKIARILRKSIRASSLLARFGGEEFVVIMPKTGRTEALNAMERIRKEIARNPFDEIGGNLTISIGIYTGIPRAGENMNSFIIKSDKALYRAKQNGRNRTEADRD
ncbi:MAG: diguanylate cyclase [Spirochaetales bacterium]|nr:diguanylate cyclase [Spirochaetales bacterium]